MRRYLLVVVSIILVALGLLKYDALNSLKSLHIESTGSYITIDDFNVYYEQRGQGPDLVFIHGIGASSEIWSTSTKGLDKYFRITLVDLPGFGRSSKVTSADYEMEGQTQRLIKILNHLKVQKAFLVGSSMGGAISLWLALKHPLRFTKVIVLSPATDPSLVKLPFYKAPGLAYLGYPLINRLSLWFSIKNVLVNDEVLTNRRVLLSLNNQEPGPSALKVMFKATELLSDPRMPLAFKNLSQPTLILWGEKDGIVPLKNVEELNKIIKNSSLYKHPAAGHHLMEDQPEWLFKKILNFFLFKSN